ncbi:cdc2-related protein kinase 3 [Plasmodium berghei ANKA]|uniref:Cyclin-dependent kinase 2 homolog n=1 Tax=Plasmodium berghei (strain Anka) TaxID=5823 RepID=A0A509AGQ5_PLABA|nr:cdc2-related protein kinase 3 [Plasmodium berghei ANKA]VUC55099.1 cdc2-related protein kinase 3 [Plasmodium berghei ANKA]|eukprot:XP_034420918.1 cdc2-related protein kinase 3 [Plasmodium berghei ANKA]
MNELEENEEEFFLNIFRGGPGKHFFSKNENFFLETNTLENNIRNKLLKNIENPCFLSKLSELKYKLLYDFCVIKKKEIQNKIWKNIENVVNNLCDEDAINVHEHLIKSKKKKDEKIFLGYIHIYNNNTTSKDELGSTYLIRSIENDKIEKKNNNMKSYLPQNIDLEKILWNKINLNKYKNFKEINKNINMLWDIYINFNILNLNKCKNKEIVRDILINLIKKDNHLINIIPGNNQIRLSNILNIYKRDKAENKQIKIPILNIETQVQNENQKNVHNENNSDLSFHLNVGSIVEQSPEIVKDNFNNIKNDQNEVQTYLKKEGNGDIKEKDKTIDQTNLYEWKDNSSIKNVFSLFSSTNNSNIILKPKKDILKKIKLKSMKNETENENNLTHELLLYSIKGEIQIKVKNIVKIHQVGQGAYGDVWMAEDIENNKRIALKKLKLNGNKEGLAKTYIREISILNSLQHKNVVELIGVIRTNIIPEEIKSNNILYNFEKKNQLLNYQNVKDKSIDSYIMPDRALKKKLAKCSSIYQSSESSESSESSSDSSDGISCDSDSCLCNKNPLNKKVNSCASIWMVFEYVPFDLSGYSELLREERQQKDRYKNMNLFTIGEIKNIMLQLFQALEYCHKNNVIHRDIKIANLLIDANGILKLADFGLARFHIDSFASNMTNRVITLWYRPPELLLGSENYSSSVDMWSCGCVLGELLTSNPLFTADNESDILKTIVNKIGVPNNNDYKFLKRLPLWNKIKFNPIHPSNINNLNQTKKIETEYIIKNLNGVGEIGLDLLKKLLKWDPLERISAHDALSHPWFRTHPLPEPIQQRCNIKAAHSFMTKSYKKRDAPKINLKKKIQENFRFLNVGKYRKIYFMNKYNGNIPQQLTSQMSHSFLPDNEFQGIKNKYTSNEIELQIGKENKIDKEEKLDNITRIQENIQTDQANAKILSNSADYFEKKNIKKNNNIPDTEIISKDGYGYNKYDKSSQNEYENKYKNIDRQNKYMNKYQNDNKKYYNDIEKKKTSDDYRAGYESNSQWGKGNYIIKDRRSRERRIRGSWSRERRSRERRSRERRSRERRSRERRSRERRSRERRSREIRSREIRSRERRSRERRSREIRSRERRSRERNWHRKEYWKRAGNKRDYRNRDRNKYDERHEEKYDEKYRDRYRSENREKDKWCGKKREYEKEDELNKSRELKKEIKEENRKKQKLNSENIKDEKK